MRWLRAPAKITQGERDLRLDRQAARAKQAVLGAERSQRGAARANNVGWRIDYQLATPGLLKKLKGCEIGFRIFPDLGVDQAAKPECE